MNDLKGIRMIVVKFKKNLCRFLDYNFVILLCFDV